MRHVTAVFVKKIPHADGSKTARFTTAILFAAQGGASQVIGCFIAPLSIDTVVKRVIKCIKML